MQAAIDSRINPLKILRPEQLSSVVPIAPAGGSLRLRAREVRPEIVPGLFICDLLMSSCRRSSDWIAGVTPATGVNF